MNKTRTDVRLLLAECSKSQNLQDGKRVHADAIEAQLDSDIYVASALICMYAKCASMDHAHQVFHNIKHPNVVCWNVLILGYAENGQGQTALGLLRTMRSGGAVPTSVTFLAAIKACSSLSKKAGSGECRKRGKEIHCIVIDSLKDTETNLQNALIDLYAKCRSTVDAYQVFSCMKHSDVVSWTALIQGYADNGQGPAALILFKMMRSRSVPPNSVTFVATLKACTSLACEECREQGRKIHDLAIDSGWSSDMKVQNTLIDMYAKCRSMPCAHRVFNSINSPSVVSWTALISGYADSDQAFVSLDLFRRMKREGFAPDAVTFAAVLKACGFVGGLDFGRSIHSEVGNRLDEVLVTSLVDFYARCGSLVEAQAVFEMHPEAGNVVTWTALLAGFSNCGDHESSFRLFGRMQETGVLPNSVTLLCVLACCRHAGLVAKGKEYFDAMPEKYGLVPAVEHYTSMIQILGRANKLEDAMALLQRMPCSPNDVTWTTLLDACRKWRILELGKLALQSLLCLNHTDAAPYVLMGHLYASRGMFQEQETVMRMSRMRRASKTAEKTCWTNELGKVHTFSTW